MATRPTATTRISTTAGAQAGGVDLICVFAPCVANADMKPRLFGSAKAVYDFHGYCEGVEYVSRHAEETRKAVLVCGLPIDVPGAISRVNNGGNTGTSAVSIVAGGTGVLAEHDGVLTVITGGTIGTSQIVLGLSCDGGMSTIRVRLGTANSYAVPWFNETINFGAGTLVAGDTVLTWHGAAPRAAAASWATARGYLAAQKKSFRTILNCGDLQSDTEALSFLAQLNAYETENARFIFGRASVYDRAPLATLSAPIWRMSGAPALTFAEVGATGDTITRAAGSWLSDGAVDGDVVTVSGSASNNVTGVIDTLSGTVITFGTTDLVAEVTSAASVVGTTGLVFANTGDTITRNKGSWLDDGFRAGMSIDVDGTAGGTNDGAKTIVSLTATVLTLASGDVDADETIGATAVTITSGQQMAAWMAEVDAEFASVDGAKRISLAAGRARKLSPFSGWNLRVSPAWAASIREYQHDVHITTWRVDEGPAIGYQLNDADDNLVEYDDRVYGGAGSAARFTTFQTSSNGPEGAFITLDLTREVESSILSYTHNVAVTNVACQVNQAATELAIGRTPLLNADGTMLAAEVAQLEQEVNNALERALLSDAKGEGPRASSAVWKCSGTDVLNVPEATVTGVLTLNLRGTIHSITTNVRLVTG